MNIKLALEDGKVFEGRSFGARGERTGEVVFNTSLSGYQEILTDPSYKGQIVTMTYPLIGNYGINDEDNESRGIFLEGFVIKELSRVVSNFRAKKPLDEYLKEHNIIGIQGIDTRALTRHIRLKGAMKAVLSTEDLDDESLVKKARSSLGLVGVDLVKEVVHKEPFIWSDKGSRKIVVIDSGVKFNILRNLEKRDCKVIVVPAVSSAKEILGHKPDGVLVSNGPGDPEAVTYEIETLKNILGKVPIFGICLGHQMLGIALGGRTYKLKFGHHGGNHPVKDIRSGKVVITSQNHGFCVDIDSLNKEDIDITHINLNDNTLEGMRHKKHPMFSVQFHPEHGPGPHDAEYLFDDFISMIDQ
ncbi:MAG: glutamine-hydrolyzing carbamoyl-phosphate synthase small subunit [Candidatus Omnitrophota bacterium]